MGNTNSTSKNKSIQIQSNESIFNNTSSEEYQTINQLQQIIQFKSFQVLFYSSKQNKKSVRQFYESIKNKSNIINIIFSQGSIFGWYYVNPITQSKGKDYPTVKNKEFIYTTKIQHNNEINIFMNKFDYHNRFSIKYKYYQHWCYCRCGIDFNKFTCWISRDINQYYINNNFDFNRILGKLGEYTSIDKIYYLELII